MICIIVDDEQLARERLRTLLNELDFDLEIHEAPNGKEALQSIKELDPALLFLDIQMPVLNGFDVIELLPEDSPGIIFTTAYDEYAIQAFEVNAIDYLLKPIRKERLQKALQRFINQQHEETKPQIQQLRSYLNRSLKRLPVQHKQDILLLPLQEICWIEASDQLVYVHTGTDSYRTDYSLDELTDLLPDTFYRIHRSTIANLHKVEKMSPWFNNSFRLVLTDGSELDVARRRTAELKQRIGLK